MVTVHAALGATGGQDGQVFQGLRKLLLQETTHMGTSSRKTRASCPSRPQRTRP